MRKKKKSLPPSSLLALTPVNLPAPRIFKSLSSFIYDWRDLANSLVRTNINVRESLLALYSLSKISFNLLTIGFTISEFSLISCKASSLSESKAFVKTLQIKIIALLVNSAIKNLSNGVFCFWIKTLKTSFIYSKANFVGRCALIIKLV